MGICTRYLNGYCHLGSRCNLDHIDFYDFIRQEVDEALNGKQWPLSCFGPFKERKCFPNFIEDVSFEELRMMYREAQEQNNIPRHKAQQLQMMNEAKQKMQWLKTYSSDIMEVLIDIYNQQLHVPAGGNPLAWPIGRSDVSATSIFGGAASTSRSGFGAGSLAFGSSNATASNMFEGVPNLSTAGLFGGGSSNPMAGRNTFGGPTRTSNTFGLPTFGVRPLQQQTSRVLDGPPVFGASGSLLFAPASRNPANTSTTSANSLPQPLAFRRRAIPNRNTLGTSASSQPASLPSTGTAVPTINNLFSSITINPTAAQPQQQQSQVTTASGGTQQSGSSCGCSQQSQPAYQSIFLPD